MTCPKCAAEAGPDEKFCAACGAPLSPEVVPLPPSPQQWENLEKIGKARKWLLIVAILTCVIGVGLYFLQKSEVEKQIRDAEAQIAGMDRETVDAHFKEAVGMTFQEAIDHDRGMVRMLLLVNLGLCAAYLLLWWWAKAKPLPASVIALLLFITTHVVNAVVEPKTLYQGILIKILFTLALVRAISAAAEERRFTTPP